MTESQAGMEVTTILVRILAVPYEDIRGKTLLREDLDIDSLDIIEIIMDLEDKFNLQIDDEVVYKWKIVQDIIDYIVGKTTTKLVGV